MLAFIAPFVCAKEAYLLFHKRVVQLNIYKLFEQIVDSILTLL